MNHDDTSDCVRRILENSVAILGSDGIGFVGPDVPIEVLFATGREFGHLPWTVAEQTPWADRWLESSFPFWVRSILEQWHAGVFDELATVVFSRGDDASQRLYYYLVELQQRNLLRGPRPLIFDIAYVRRDSSIDHTATALRSLCRVFGVEADELSEGIEQANALRRTLQTIEAARHGDGPLHERVGRAALWSKPSQWLDSGCFPVRPAGNPRVLLAGSVPPDDRIHRAVEASGAGIVAEAHMYGSDRLGPEIVCETDDPALAIANHLQRASKGPRAMIDRAQALVERARSVRASAVLIWLTHADEAIAWHVPAQRQALATAGIPTHVLPASNWQFDEQSRNSLNEFLTDGIDAAV